MPKRIALGFLNILWYSTASMIVLAAVVVEAGRELLPHIRLDNQHLMQVLSERTGASIQVSELRGQWTYLSPDFSAGEVSIDTPALHIRLKNVRMEVDILRSLWRQSPVFDRLDLEQATIDYTQPDPAAAPGNIDQNKVWQIAYRLLDRNIHIRDVALQWRQGDIGHYVKLQDFRLEKSLAGKKIFLRLLDQDSNAALTATGMLHGSTIENSEGRLYLKLAGWPLQAWLASTVGNAAINPAQSSPLVTALQQAWQADGEAWLDWRSTDTATLTANVAVHNAGQVPAAQLPYAATSHLSARWQRDNGAVIDLHSLALQAAADQPSHTLLEHVRLSLRNAAQWRLQSPRLALDNWQVIAPYLPENALTTLLHSLHPTGQLRNIDLQWDNGKPLTERLQLRANAANLATGAWHGVPAFTGVSGYLQSGIGYGFIDLDSRDGFSMHYPEIYHQPLVFHQANGRVQWQWQPEQKTVLVGADYLQLLGDAGDARGNFWLHLPLPGADFHSEMYLAIGLRHSAARFRRDFLPYTLPPHLLAWLEQSIGDADVPAAGFLYRGTLSGNEPHSRTIQFFADIDNGDLQFDPAWPRLSAVQAHLLVDDGNTSVRARNGQMLGLTIDDAVVDVRQENPGMAVRVQARAKGSSTDGLRMLRETPLHTAIGTALDSWRMPKGSMAADLQLLIPLGGANLTPQQTVDVSLADSLLLMDDLRLQFDNLQGSIRYDNNSGLSSPGIQGMFFGKPLTLSISSQKSTDRLNININGKGSAAMSDIARWSRLDMLQLLHGNVDYNAALSLGPFGKPSAQTAIGQLQLSSDMTSISAPLPSPFSTARGVRKPLVLTVDLYRDNRQDYRLDFNRQISGMLSIRQGQLYSGDVVLLGEQANLPARPGPVTVHGELPSGNLQEWLDLVAAYNALPRSTAASSTPAPEFTVTIHDATWRDMAFPQLRINAAHEADAWRLYFDSGNARGSAYFHDDKRITSVNLSELKLYSKPTAGDASENPLPRSTISFADIPSLDIRIDHLLYNDMDIGSFSTALRTTPDSLQLQKLLISGPGYSVYNQQGNDGALLSWRQTAAGQYQSAFRGMLHMQGEQPALVHLGFDPLVRGKNIYVAPDIRWAGSPDQISMKSVEGQVQMYGEQGKYLQAQPNTAMKLLNVIDITNWVRRLRLDFSDLGNDGISFDKFSGTMLCSNDTLEFVKPLRVESPSSTMELSGRALLESEQVDLRLNATLPVGNNATWITALAGGLPAAAGVYVVSKVFDSEIKNITSLTYSITGSMKEPDIRFERMAKPRKWPRG